MTDKQNKLREMREEFYGIAWETARLIGLGAIAATHDDNPYGLEEAIQTDAIKGLQDMVEKYVEITAYEDARDDA